MSTSEEIQAGPELLYGSPDRSERFRDWIHTEASLEGVIRSLQKKAIHAKDALGPIHEWIDYRLKKDPWIQSQLALVTEIESQEFKFLLYRAINAFSEKYYGSPARQSVPHIHRLHTERARNAIQKLAIALNELDFDPEITYLINQPRHEWAKQLLSQETDDSPQETRLLAQMLQGEQIDHDAAEELRSLWHSRKQAPKAQDLLKALDFRLSLLRTDPVMKFSARSMFLRTIWSGLGTHTLEKRRMKFVTHVDDAVFPGHWTGDPETRTRELNRITSDIRKQERSFKKFFPELQGRLRS